MEKYAVVSGVLRQASPNDNPMVVALFAEKLRRSALPAGLHFYLMFSYGGGSLFSREAKTAP